MSEIIVLVIHYTNQQNVNCYGKEITKVWKEMLKLLLLLGYMKG